MNDPRRPPWKRLAWFFGLAVASGAVAAAIAYGLRAMPLMG